MTMYRFPTSAKTRCKQKLKFKKMIHFISNELLKTFKIYQAAVCGKKVPFPYLQMTPCIRQYLGVEVEPGLQSVKG